MQRRGRAMEKTAGDRNSTPSSGSMPSSGGSSDWSVDTNYFTSTGRKSAESSDSVGESSIKLIPMDRYSRYQIYYYGTPGEKEAVNKETREILKKQQELILPPYRQFVNRVAESKAIARRVMLEELAEQEKEREHYKYMTTFRDGNKSLMDYNMRKKKELKQMEIGQERRRLRLNPINWNHTLW